MTDKPGLSKIVPASVNERVSPTVAGTEVTTDEQSKLATVLAPVVRTLRKALR